MATQPTTWRPRARPDRSNASALVVGLLALLALLGALRGGGVHRAARASSASNDAPSVHSGRNLQSFEVHRAENELRAKRRPAPHVDSPLPGNASAYLRLLLTSSTAAFHIVARHAVALIARGYDATAPPLPALSPLSLI